MRQTTGLISELCDNGRGGNQELEKWTYRATWQHLRSSRPHHIPYRYSCQVKKQALEPSSPKGPNPWSLPRSIGVPPVSSHGQDGCATTKRIHHRERLPAAGGSTVNRNFSFALRRINNLREVPGEERRADREKALSQQIRNRDLYQGQRECFSPWSLCLGGEYFLRGRGRMPAHHS